MASNASKSAAGGFDSLQRWPLAVARLVLTIAITCLGLLLITFLISRVIPVDPVLAAVGDRASKSTYDKMFLEMGLDKPLWEEFLIYIQKVLVGDLGNSFLTKRPVLGDLARAFPATLELATVSILIGTLVGVPLGVLSAVKSGTLTDQVARVVGLVGYSVPVFWLGLLGLLVFYAHFGWVAGPGRIDIAYEYNIQPLTGLLLLDSAMQGEWEVFGNIFSHIILPACLLGYYSLAYISRMTRSFMLTELSQEYITTARVKGVPEWRIIWVHALRNAAVPLVTVIALSYAGLLEGSVLTETVFAWPGLGLYLTNSLQAVDMNAVLGGTLLIGAVFIVLNLISDLLYSLLDPRVRRRVDVR